MNKLMIGAAMLALAGTMVGCATGGAGEDKIAAWQKERTPVEVLHSKIEIQAAGAIVEALDVDPFGIYKPIADKVDSMAVIDRCRRAYQMYVGTIKELMEGEQKLSKEDAIKEANAQLDALAEKDPQIKADIKAYLEETQKTNFDECIAWANAMFAEIQKASEKFANEAPNALQQLMDIAQREGGMAVVKIPSQGKDELAVIGAQLADSGKGIALYIEMVNADKEAAAMQAEYPIEG